jgi:MGT family glycosyltransferase
MRTIVFVTPPAHGHVNPTLPVIRELVQRGEQVIAYNTEEFRPQLEQAGARFKAYPHTAMTATSIALLLQEGNLANMTELILRTTEQLLPFMVQELTTQQPDLVIFDSIALWGKMAAAQLHLRAAASLSVFVMDERHIRPRDMFPMLRHVLPKLPAILSTRRRLVARYGKAFPSKQPLFPLRDALNIVFTARELQPDTPIIDQTFRFVGPSIDLRTRSGSFPLDTLEQDSVVYISLGTVHSTHTAFFQTCFEAFAEHPMRFVLSVGRQTDIDRLGAIPANFIVRSSVPQLELLQRASIFITHGGMNSVHEGLYYGVPLVIIPHQFEQLFNARCVAARGAGYIIDDHLKHKPITANALRRALAVVLSAPRYRVAAQELQRALHRTGGYEQAASEIQAYLAKSTLASGRAV